MQNSEAWITDTFAAWLEANDWIVRRDVDFWDLVAERDGERLLVEVKGHTSAPGLDLDTAYGQLLRRMTGEASTRYALVIPESVVATARRVPAAVRAALAIDVFGVDANGRVERVTD